MSDTPKTDLIEAEYWDGHLNARDVFERMGDMEAELAAAQEESERMKKAMIYLGHKTQQYHMQQEVREKELVNGIKSILPKPPYHPTLEPEWVYLNGLVNKGGGAP